MNVQEFDTALSELETRVDRLRALYENWFRGYEKMEPQVARKDVERRVYGLRKELPRNTALRFRYHQLYQRYTTLASYWQRTARQIEEGTYRLQLQRMKRRRPGDDQRLTNLPPQRGDSGETLPPPSYDLSLDESLDVNSLLDELDLDQIARSIDMPGPFSTPPMRASLPAASRGTTPPSSPTRDAGFAAALSNSLPPAVIPSVTSARFARPSVANDALPAPGPASLASPPATVSGPARPSLPNKPPPLKIPLPNAAGTGRMSLPTPNMSIRPGTGSIPGLPPLPPRSGTPSIPNTGGPSARPPALGPRPSLPAPLTVEPPRAVVVQPPARTDAPGAVNSGLSEQRLRRLHEEYAAARRKNNEGDVRYETLASSIQKMMPDLSKKHQGKQIDFEVVLKDGRVGLKPRAT